MRVPQLPLPIAPIDALRQILLPAWQVLPPAMSTVAAQVFVLAAMLQESNLAHRWQVVDLKRPDVMGPARGLAQFELGAKGTGAGVWGVFEHPASRYWLAQACVALGVEFNPRAIWLALAGSDALAAVLARLLAFTDPRPLPAVSDAEGAWKCYLRNWRPGAYTNGSAKARAALKAKFLRNHGAARLATR